jgi:hypothetical protein
MIVNIEIEENDHKAKEKFLNYIGRVTKKPVKRTYELDKAFCTNAKLAYNYLYTLFLDIDYVGHGNDLREFKFNNPEECRLSEELESVFSKNTVYAINYLAITNQKEFSNNDLNKKIMKRVYNNPDCSFFYSAFILKKRLPREKEKVFLKSNKAMYHYSKFVIKGKFEEEIEKSLKLRTFTKEYIDHQIPNNRWQLKDIDYLKLYFNNTQPEINYCYYYIRSMCKF